MIEDLFLIVSALILGPLLLFVGFFGIVKSEEMKPFGTLRLEAFNAITTLSKKSVTAKHKVLNKIVAFVYLLIGLGLVLYGVLALKYLIIN